MKTNNKIFNTGLIYFVILALFVGIRIGTSLGVFSFLGAWSEFVLTAIVQVGLLIILPLLLNSYLNKKRIVNSFRDFNVNKIDFKTVLASIVIGFIVFILTVVISMFFSVILSYFGYAGGGSSEGISSWGEFFISIILIAILPAIGEEFLHRGFLINGLSRLGVKKTIIYSSLLFGLMHMNVGQFFYASIIGAVLAAVAIFSRSIIPAIIVHFMNNAISVYLNFASTKNLPGGNAINRVVQFLTEGNFIVSIIFALLFISLLVILLFYLLMYLLEKNAKKSAQKYAERVAIEQMRREILGGGSKEQNKVVVGRNLLRLQIRAEDSYDFLGFYITQQTKTSKLDLLFINASILLGGLITIFTFIWGIL